MALSPTSSPSDFSFTGGCGLGGLTVGVDDNVS